MMKKLTLITLLVLFAKGLAAQVSFGQATKLNDDWRFLRVDSAWNVSETPDMKSSGYDDSRWRTVTLPHDWGVELPMSPDKGSCQGYLPGGIGWYRKHFRIENGELKTESYGYNRRQGTAQVTHLATLSSQLYLYFEGIYNHAEVYLNGHLLGMRPSGFASVLYNVTPYLNKDGENTIAVRVNHSQEFDSRWYTGSGINRNVWIVTAPDVHLAQWGTAYRLKSIDKRKAVVEVDIETTDERADKSSPMVLIATINLRDAEGNIAATSSCTIGTQQKKTVSLTVRNPKRWTLEQPYLYTLQTTIVPNLKASPQTDQSEVKVGLRTLDFSPDHGFALNGQPTKVKGVCLHDDAGVLGTAVPTDVWCRRLIELKNIGVNAIRMSHNPHAPELYDLCDSLGLLVMDEASDEWEFPKRKWMKGWNQGNPEYQGTYTYFEEWIERDVADMVRRDRCHPSIFLWSIGNEVDYPNDPYSHPVLNRGGSDFTQPMYGGYKPEQPNAERIGKIAQKLAAIVRNIDTSRPTTGALAGVVMSNETAYPSAIDVVGYNYTESRYDEDHQKYPDRVIYGSENRHDLPAWKAVRDKEHIFGQFLWTGIDYLGESGVWPARGSSAGLLDLAGQRKPMGWYRAALWSEKPVCYIGTQPLQREGRNQQRRAGVSPYANDNWNYNAGDRIRVMCYTNASTARLILNGQAIGGQPQRDKDTDILYWDIDYAPGTLRCEADNNAAYEIKTSQRPYALRLTTDKQVIHSAENVAHIFVEIIDEQGNRVKQADNEVTLAVEGGRLLGMENGSIMGPTGTTQQRRFQQLRAAGGTLVAYVQPRNQQTITIRATSPFLQPATLTLDVK